VVQACQHLRLALETGEALGIRRKLRRQDLDRHLATEPLVGGAVDLTHATGAEGL